MEIIRYVNRALLREFYENHHEDVDWLVSHTCYKPYPGSNIILPIKIIIPDKEE